MRTFVYSFHMGLTAPKLHLFRLRMASEICKYKLYFRVRFLHCVAFSRLWERQFVRDLHDL